MLLAPTQRTSVIHRKWTSRSIARIRQCNSVVHCHDIHHARSVWPSFCRRKHGCNPPASRNKHTIYTYTRGATLTEVIHDLKWCRVGIPFPTDNQVPKAGVTSVRVHATDLHLRRGIPPLLRMLRLESLVVHKLFISMYRDERAERLYPHKETYT